MVVCDVCSTPNATSITIRAGSRNYAKDLCSRHLAELLKDTRAPRRGRPRASSPKATGSKPSAAKRTRGGKARKSTSSRKRSSRKKAAKSG